MMLSVDPQSSSVPINASDLRACFVRQLKDLGELYRSIA